MTMHIFILGGTGRVGGEVLRLALNDGHSATALVRDPRKLGRLPDRLAALQGDACREADVLAAMRGADAVVSCLGTDGGAALTSSMPLVIRAMRAHGIDRIVTVGTAGILQSREHPGLLRYEAPESRRSSVRAAEEHRKAWELLASSGLTWTVVCPTYLPDGERIGRYRVEKDVLPEGGTSISVGDTAEFTYKQVLSREFAGCRVGIAY